MKTTYIPVPKNPKGRKGRPIDPDKWITGPSLERREKYYAFLKHKAQCQFRKEDYDLTFDDWENLWPDELYEQRGRSRDSLLLTRYDMNDAWTLSNCLVQKRYEHLARRKEYPKK